MKISLWIHVVAATTTQVSLWPVDAVTFQGNSKIFKKIRHQTGPTCASVPKITHSDVGRMIQDCKETPVNRECRISCAPNYHPSTRSVKCVKDGSSAKWDLRGASCESKFDTVCRDKNHNKVGWFIVYRFPKYSEQKENECGEINPDYEKHLGGGRYIYMSDKNTENKNDWWELWERYDELNTLQPGNPLSNTLVPLNNAAQGTVKYALYSDQYGVVDDGISCSCDVKSNMGHAKGVVMTDNNKNGVFMVHSQPKFPGKPGKGEKFSLKYGQMFMCISFDSEKYLKDVLDYVSELRPHVYASKDLIIPTAQPVILPSNCPKKSSSRKGSTKAPSFVISGPPFKKWELPSSNNKDKFDLLAKTRAVDIYSEVLAKHYDSDFMVLTWRHGTDKLPRTDRISDVTEFQYGDNLIRLEHTEGKEHSKWAVSSANQRKKINDKDIFCISDLNRMGSQLKRGGGAVCIHDSIVADRFRDMIAGWE